jgi:hypothetical protein
MPLLGWMYVRLVGVRNAPRFHGVIVEGMCSNRRSVVPLEIQYHVLLLSTNILVYVQLYWSTEHGSDSSYNAVLHRATVLLEDG